MEKGFVFIQRRWFVEGSQIHTWGGNCWVCFVCKGEMKFSLPVSLKLFELIGL